MRHRCKRPLCGIINIIAPFSTRIGTVGVSLHGLRVGNGSRRNLLAIKAIRSLRKTRETVILFSPICSGRRSNEFLSDGDAVLGITISHTGSDFLMFNSVSLVRVRPTFSPQKLLTGCLFSSSGGTLRFRFRGQRSLVSTRARVSALRNIRRRSRFLGGALTKTRGGVAVVSP